jgi:U3 small nucleolar RNA-associated protein 15
MAATDHDGTYLKLPVKRYAPRSIRETAEGRYWRAYKSPALLNQVSQVTSVAFAEAYPHHLAVTSSARVTVYNSKSRRPHKTFQRFKDVAYSGVLRADGKALAVGGQQGWVQLFDTSSRAVLRKFTLHTRAARAVRFSPHSHGILCSASDDTTVRLWDVAAGACATRHDGHTDYARSVAGHPFSATTWASGSYDGTVKLWDSRVNGGKGGCGMTLRHGAPVEDVQWLPGGAMLVSVGGQDVCVWDALSGGKLLRKMRCHQKTVMCAHVAPDGGPPPVEENDVFESFQRGRSATDRTSPRLLTGSLDGHVKVHELDGFSVTHSAKYPGPVLSVALSPDASVLAGGHREQAAQHPEALAHPCPRRRGGRRPRRRCGAYGSKDGDAREKETGHAVWTRGRTNISRAGKTLAPPRGTLASNGEDARAWRRTTTRLGGSGTARR